MDRSVFSADFKAEPYWWEAAHPVVWRGGELPARTDVLVIGSGYTGLAAALQTQRAGRATTVIDSEAPGWGCSSRNGGQISTSIKPDLATLTRKHGRERALGILREGRNALSWLEELVDREQMECDFRICGRFHGAHTRGWYDRLARGVENHPPGLESDAVVVPRSEQRAEIDTDYYHGGVLHPGHASVNPTALHRELARLVQDAGGEIHGHCAAVSIKRDGDEYQVGTAKGRLRARDVVLATNGYTGAITPWHRRRIIPIGSYIIATEELPEELVRRLIPNDRMIGDTRKVVFYYRASPDARRIVFGGRVSATETDPEISGPKLHREMVRIFPELEGARISHSWMGFVAYTFDTLAHLGRHEGVYYAMGYCGSGVSMATYLGCRIGQQLLGDPEGETAFDGLAFESRPFYGGAPWFLSSAVRFYQLHDYVSRGWDGG